MDLATARELNAMTSDFYRRKAVSFSSTRERGWPGWERLAACLGLEEKPSLSLLDVACGNFRFERWLASEHPGLAVSAHAVDGCRGLAESRPCPPSVSVSFQELDVVEELLEGSGLAESIASPPCELVVCFGFFHHVPGFDARVELLSSLLEKAVPGGHVAISLWRFMDDPHLADKAESVTRRAVEERGLSLDEGDWLLGWQDDDDALRYCHSFGDEEVFSLVEAVSGRGRLAMRYRDDGRTGKLDEYLVFERL